ncbi:cytochrome P450 [Cercophora newfieldiana]|uniref:Cytochrome P450 n=1 Tax=Cercophora newfieldiana TaxID=92897 RepID=A0AA39YE16_9PEZI|nr:cytochrome P450 [Cercophora newfieldiana]
METPNWSIHHAVPGVVSFQVIAALIGLYVSFSLASKAYRIFIYPHYVSPLRHLPGPKDGNFLMGQVIKDFASGNPNEPFMGWMRKWPNVDFIRYLSFFNSDSLLVVSLAAQKEILGKHCYSFAKPPLYSKLAADIVGRGLGVAEVHEHMAQRKVLNVLFGLTNLKKYMPVFRRTGRELVRLFEQAIDKNNGYIKLTPTFSKLTLDIMGIFALGIELNNLEGSTIFEACYHDMFEPPLAGQLLIAINAYFPIRWLPIKLNRDFIRAKDIVRSQLRDIVKERIAELQGEKAYPSTRQSVTEADDLLTFLVREKYLKEGEDGRKWTETEILEQIITFMAAGHETTAISLVWATHMLSLYPDVASRLRKEARELLATKPDPDYLELETLPYMDKFTKELFRYLSSAVLIPRCALEDVTVLGTFIPKGTNVMVMPALFHHNPTIWGEDCDEFNPDRWDNITDKITDPYALAAFSQGPRVCIGRAMAILQFKSIVVELVSRFEFKNVEGVDVEVLNPNLLYRPKSGLNIRVKRAN